MNRAVRLRVALAWAIALAALAWVLRGLSPRELLREMVVVRWGLVVVAVGADILSYVAQAARWSLLLAPLGRLPLPDAVRAVYSGLFVNEVAPLRAGEPLRALIAARRLERDFVSVIPSIAVERLFDGVWVALAVGLTAALVPIPHRLVRGEELLAGLVLVGVILFVRLVLRDPGRSAPGEAAGSAPPPATRAGRIRARVRAMGDEIGRIGRDRGAFLAFVLSGLFLALQALSFWLVMRASGITLPAAAGAAVFLIVHLGTALPNAPSNVGTFQLFTVLGLSLFGVPRTDAAAFSITVFVILTVPLWVIGGIALARSGQVIRPRIISGGEVLRGL